MSAMGRRLTLRFAPIVTAIEQEYKRRIRQHSHSGDCQDSEVAVEVARARLALLYNARSQNWPEHDQSGEQPNAKGQNAAADGWFVVHAPRLPVRAMSAIGRMLTLLG